ncbi:MAG: pyridoxamine 5'-phosphate oxidase family protein [Rikenellaceae bacterium]|jgi:nitroimidazol reductase NimA-like FMN-containing flavoprotein (pyridoxamine 5'-phosphate oxidase superfamily)|nr:pyridoxamine 5'-phosphate oxidase family protein [Rikenellaceae bacterium]
MREIRRRDRLLDEVRAAELLQTAEYGFLSLGAGTDGYAYGVPLNFVFVPAGEGPDPGEGADNPASHLGTLWFHCAPEGHKLDCLLKDDRMSFCVVGRTEPVPEQFTTRYESVIAFGRAAIVTDESQRIEGLRLLVRKYCPGLEKQGESYISRSLHRTGVIRMEVKKITAKGKKKSVNLTVYC